ncbi:MAG: winged helix-turn-helix transcriptional regulator [Fibrobacterota bacterium]|nr:winged helix-turn-helix transcriptional regulator [Fibrobacterota bacterium]QQS03428.1 MAG: winged helix-turn-helix transcriptional regulator [Fibrobacterota bacterium]
MAKYGNVPTLEELAEVAAALGEPKRLHALGLLSHGELCLCDLTDGLGLSPSTVSSHMAILKRAGLVETRKDGRWMHFRLSDTNPSPAAAQALSWAMANLPKNVKTKIQCAKDGCCP